MKKTFLINEELHDALLIKYLNVVINDKENKKYSSSFYKRISRLLGKFIFTNLKEIDTDLFNYFNYKIVDCSNVEYIEIEGLGYKTISRAFPKNKNGYAIKQFIDLIGYFIYENSWSNLKPKLGAHIKKTSNNLVENKNSLKIFDNTKFRPVVSSFISKEFGKENLIEHDKFLKGISGIRRQIDFYLLLKSTSIKIEWVIDCFYTKEKINLATIEGVYAKQKDCRVHKSGLITNIGFDESATKFGIMNKMYLAVIPKENNIEYVSKLKTNKIIGKEIVYIVSSNEEKYKQTVPKILKNKVLSFYFNINKNVDNSNLRIVKY
jgi:hypothetical protein